MATVFSVQADSREDCARELDRLCDAFDLVPILAPIRPAGSDRWMARAKPTAPAGEGQGRGV